MIRVLCRRAPLAAVLLALLAWAGCSEGGPTEPSASGEGQISLFANVSSTSIVALVVEVTAADIPEPLIFNIPIVNGIGSGTITIPAGSDRTITVHAFDSSEIKTHEGSVTIDVAEGQNPTVSITLFPLVGVVPIEVTIGGLKIYFHSNRDGNDEIYRVNASGTELTRLTDDLAGDRFPAVSPDGTQIAFHSNRDGNDEVYVANADGSAPMRLTNDPARDAHPSWSPDGTKIAFETARDGNFEVYVMNVDGTDLVNLTRAC